jgi:hypothetical protein
MLITLVKLNFKEVFGDPYEKGIFEFFLDF